MMYPSSPRCYSRCHVEQDLSANVDAETRVVECADLAQDVPCCEDGSKEWQKPSDSPAAILDALPQVPCCADAKRYGEEDGSALVWSVEEQAPRDCRGLAW